MTLLGTDVYSGNSAAKVTAAIRRADMAFTIAKATEGRTFKDQRHHAIRTEVKDAGDVFGSYHFSWLSNPGADEAKAFLDWAQPQDGELVAGDFEDWGPKDANGVRTYMVGVSWAQRFKHAVDWVTTVIDETGTRPLIYVNWNFLKGFRTAATVADWEWFIDNPLWLAQWQTGGVQTLPGQFDYAAPKAGSTKEWHPTFHQYISGSTASSGLDEDWFVGDRAALESFTIQTEELFTVGQYEDIMGALAALSQRVETIEGVMAETRDALAGVEVSIEETEDAMLAKMSEVNGTLGVGQAGISAHLDTLADEVGTRTATVVSTAIVESLDRALGGIEVSARYTRQKGM